MTFFSVILATRDRPAQFAEALGSVLAQRDADIEIIVVDDGSRDENRPAYDGVLASAAQRAAGRIHQHRLVHRPRGHGQSYALNLGVARARGEYVCFLDDDDCWTDLLHLSRAAAVIGAGGAVDLYMANQVAYRGDTQLPGPIWIEALADGVARRGVVPRPDGSLPVTVEDLLAIDGFCHINALVIRRAFYEAVGGMDEGIRWECDRDLYLRLVDQAGMMLHHPAIVARHNVPDPAQGGSMTTSLAMLDRWLYQLRVLDKSSLFARHPAIRAHARQHKAFALKRVAEERHAARDWSSAAFYARQALGAGPTLKWLAFTLYCGARAGLGRDRGVADQPKT